MIEYPRYIKEHGSYYLIGKPLMTGERNLLYMCDVIAIAFETALGEVLLLQVGSPEDIQKYVGRYRATLLSAGDLFSREMADGIRSVTLPADFDAEEINRCLHTTGYLKILLEQHFPEALSNHPPR